MTLSDAVDEVAEEYGVELRDDITRLARANARLMD